MMSVNAPELWPKKSDRRVFRKWFNFELEEVVFEAGRVKLLYGISEIQASLT